MARPQPTDAHLRIAHSIQEQIMVSDFSKRQRKILDLILRLSWGCGKKEAIIPHQKDFEIVGIYEGDIKEELNYLLQAKVIFINTDKYSFNKDYDQWRISRSKSYTPQRLSDLLSLNLQKLSETLIQYDELSETLTENLVKHEVGTSQNTKFPTSELASPKESIKESIKENTLSYKEYGEFKNVLLTDESYQKLVEKLTKTVSDNLIEQLSIYMQQSPANAKKYKDHYATILNWHRRDNDKNGGNGNGRTGTNPRELPKIYTRPDEL